MKKTLRGLLLAAILPAPMIAAAEADEDPFLWLEDVQDEAALDWVRERNARTFAELRDNPVFDTLYAEAFAIMTSDSRLPKGKIIGDEYHDFWQDQAHVRGVWRRTPIAALARGEPAWETVLDFDRLAASENENWVYKNIDCTGGERGRCLVAMSRGGKDESVWREFSLAERTFVDGGFVTPEAKNWVAWAAPDTLVIATDFGPESLTSSGYPREARLWRRGTPLADAPSLFKADQDDTLLAPQAYTSGDTTRTFLFRLHADWNEIDIHAVRGNEAGERLPLPARVLAQGMVGHDLVLLLKEPWTTGDVTHAAGDVVAYDVESGKVQRIYAPGPSEAIDEVEAGAGGVYLQLLDDVVGRIRRVMPSPDGWQAVDIPVPDNGVARLAGSSASRADLFVTFESAIQPSTMYYVDADNRLRDVLHTAPLYDAAGVVIRQRFATSADGTRVPYFLVGREDVIERGDAPTILYGYGGFLVPTLPVYYEDPSRPQHGALAGSMWISRGGLLALSNIRGGGEYGPRWHQAAMRDQRQRAFDDFIAVAEDMIDAGITSPARLGALGRSNGGLLLGAALTQRPDLFAAFDIGVPLLDMRRYNKLLAGSSWMGEYGNPDVAEDWAFIREYSPYQNLERGKDYPRVLFYTSTLDDRVHPGHARKMAAALEALGHAPFYYENIEGGHGGTANQDQLAMRTALEYAYFVRMLMPAAWDRQDD